MNATGILQRIAGALYLSERPVEATTKRARLYSGLCCGRHEVVNVSNGTDFL